MKAALHPLEQQRLAALDRYDILDTPAESAFDDIVELVAAICETPIAVVNLVAEGRQFFKAEIGIGVREMPLEPSICAHALLLEDLMVIPDTLEDRRFTDNPLVTGEPGLRFYAGALLKTEEGLPLGTLCVLDLSPRQPRPAQLRALQTLSKHVMHLLEMRRTQKLEAALKCQVDETLAAHKRLINSVCHDLRTPVNTIALSAAFLAQHEQQEMQDTAGRLRRMSEQMTGLIDDLQDFDALQSGRLSLSLAPVNASDLLDNVGDAFSLAARQANVSLHVERPNALPAILTDRRRCAQMLSNLVQNAIKFTPEGGRVVVRAEPGKSSLRFAVDDTGIGIDESEMSSLFLPHWRSANVKDTPGTGLGLSIVKMLANQHGTDVEVRSSPGAGSSFAFDLPFAPAGRAAIDEQPDGPQ